MGTSGNVTGVDHSDTDWVLVDVSWQESLGKPALAPASRILPPGFVDAIRARVAAMPYAQTLREVGVEEDDLPMLSRDAMNVQRLLVNNPRDVACDDAVALYSAAF